MAFELDTKALRYFVAVASHKSFTRAAAFLRITQPAVTRQIQAIERAFGVRLFRRQGQHIVPTEAGETLWKQAAEILERIDAATALVKGAAAEPTGRLSIGAPAWAGESILPSVLADYRRKFPKVFVRVVTGYTGDLVEMLAHDRLDLAMVYGDPSHGDLELQPLADSDLGLVGPATKDRQDPLRGRDGIGLEEAARLPLIFPSPTHTLRKVVDQACRDIGVQPNLILESDSYGLSKALVKAGMGYMFLSYESVRSDVEAGELRFLSLVPEPIPWKLSIATRRAKSTSLACRMMIKDILARAR